MVFTLSPLYRPRPQDLSSTAAPILSGVARGLEKVTAARLRHRENQLDRETVLRRGAMSGLLKKGHRGAIRSAEDALGLEHEDLASGTSGDLTAGQARLFDRYTKMADAAAAAGRYDLQDYYVRKAGGTIGELTVQTGGSIPGAKRQSRYDDTERYLTGEANSMAAQQGAAVQRVRNRGMPPQVSKTYDAVGNTLQNYAKGGGAPTRAIQRSMGRIGTGQGPRKWGRFGGRRADPYADEISRQKAKRDFEVDQGLSRVKQQDFQESASGEQRAQRNFKSTKFKQRYSQLKDRRNRTFQEKTAILNRLYKSEDQGGLGLFVDVTESETERYHAKTMRDNEVAFYEDRLRRSGERERMQKRLEYLEGELALEDETMNKFSQMWADGIDLDTINETVDGLLYADLEGEEGEEE